MRAPLGRLPGLRSRRGIAGVAVEWSTTDAKYETWWVKAHNATATQGWVQAVAICATVAQ